VTAIFVLHVHPLEPSWGVPLTTLAALTAAAGTWCAFFPPAALLRTFISLETLESEAR
jgi:ABC-type dipeptide/oligopeptide/nickel transport system permease subunit